jgi:hypothetical protein
MAKEQMRNRKGLTGNLCVYTISHRMAIGRPPKPEHLRRSKLFPLRLTPDEWTELDQAARKLGEPVAALLRKGALLYIHRRGKGGSRTKGDTNR